MKNVGSTDRIIRIVLGIGIGYFANSTSFETAWIQALLFIVAAVMLFTSILGFCPLYSIFQTNTCETK